MKPSNNTEFEKNLRMTFGVSYILVIFPISVYILYLGFLRWKLERNAPLSVSHSDFFAYNMAFMELIGVLGYVLWLVTRNDDVAFLMGTFPWYAETVFPVFTSIEQYMAVVYPITYLSLKRGKHGLWVRYVSILIVWLFTFVKTIMMKLLPDSTKVIFTIDMIEIAIYFFIMIFCSVSVLCALCQPKPGNGTKVDKSKRKPFFILLLILVVLVFRFIWNMWMSVFCAVSKRGSADECFMLGEAVNWVNMITMLLTPLLYLQRAGKLCTCGLK